MNLAMTALQGVTGVPGLSNALPASLRSRYPEVFGTGDTVFEKMDGKIDIRDAQVNFRDFRLAARDYAVVGKGRYSLENQLDMSTVMTFSQALSDDLVQAAQPMSYLRSPEGRVAFTRTVAGKWTYPVAADVDRDPSFSPDGKRLYFIKTRPFKEGEVPGGDPEVKEEYWYLEKTDSGWSAPISAGEQVNAIGVHWPCSVDREGNLYFSEFADHMYCSQYVDGTYETPTRLTEYLNNATLVGRSPFISPDGDYLLFSASDSLNISFKKKDGAWTDRINLGSAINASHENGSPRITADGKYMFFVSAGQGRPWGIYWVSAEFIDRLRAEHLSDR